MSYVRCVYTDGMQARKHSVVEAIAAFFSEQQDIRLSILYGSFANGQPNRDSDIDIAVVADQPLDAERRIELISKLAQLSGRAVDLVDLATAGVTTARSVLLNGEVLTGRNDSAYAEQISRMLLDSADFLPCHERILEERRKAWIG